MPPKKKSCSHLATAYQVGQENRNRFRLWFFWTYFSTSDVANGGGVLPYGRKVHGSKPKMHDGVYH